MTCAFEIINRGRDPKLEHQQRWSTIPRLVGNLTSIRDIPADQKNSTVQYPRLDVFRLRLGSGPMAGHSCLYRFSMLENLMLSFFSCRLALSTMCTVR